MVQANTFSANAIINFGFVLAPATQEFARQIAISAGSTTNSIICKNWTHMNITAVNSVVNVYGYLTATPTVSGIVKAELKAVRL